MVRLSRYFLLIAGIVAFAVVLPELYWMAFAKPVKKPLVFYSCIENDFLIQRSDSGITRKDPRGKSYTREEYEQRLPLMYVRQLLMSNTMPDSIYGIEVDNHAITVNRSTFRVQPKELSIPDPGLYPLFESQSGRANLVMPDDFFRITWRMEFVDAKTNKTLEEKSQMFSAVLYKRGFKFPVKSISGLPTTRKSCDEGYLVIDAEDQLFHVKMVKGEPYVKKAELPGGTKFKHINCVDFRNTKFYAYLFSTDNHIYILTQDDYELIELPVGEMDPEKHEIRIFGDLFHYQVSVVGDDFIRTVVLDTDYKKVDEYNESWPGIMERREGKIFKTIFPGQISMTSPDSSLIRFYTEINKPFLWLVFSAVLMVVQLFIFKQREIALKNQVVDLCVIGVTGIFGFLAVNIFQNKFFD